MEVICTQIVFHTQHLIHYMIVSFCFPINYFQEKYIKVVSFCSPINYYQEKFMKTVSYFSPINYYYERLTRYEICLTVFGMNVGGVPWTQQKDPKLKIGFRNVMLLCVVTLFFVLSCFLFPFLYSRLMLWRRQRALERNWSFSRRSFLKRTIGGGERGGYLRL